MNQAISKAYIATTETFIEKVYIDIVNENLCHKVNYAIKI